MTTEMATTIRKRKEDRRLTEVHTNENKILIICNHAAMKIDRFLFSLITISLKISQ